MHGRGKSDSAILATNKAGRPAAEPVGRRVGTEGNAEQPSSRRAQDRESVSQALSRVLQAADRFAVKHPRWEPSHRIGPARIYARGAQ